MRSMTQLYGTRSKEFFPALVAMTTLLAFLYGRSLGIELL